jgi:hypothetical protein
MIKTPTQLEAQPISVTVGLFDDGAQYPVQIAFKTDGNQWALAGQKNPWSTESLFDTAVRERLVFKVLVPA